MLARVPVGRTRRRDVVRRVARELSIDARTVGQHLTYLVRRDILREEKERRGRPAFPDSLVKYSEYFIVRDAG